MKSIILRWIPVYLFVIVGIVMMTICWSNWYSAVSGNRIVRKGYCFIIDAGHGGIDGGAVSCTGVNESVINLQIAERLNDLMRILGYQTKMTRTEDVSIHTKGDTIAGMKASDLKERTKIVNEMDHAILLSIHQNHYSESYYHGGQMFYAASEGSKELAIQLQKEWISCLNPDSHRQAKKAEGIYLMKHIQKPGVLIECGFLSNYHEEKQLRSDSYQKKLCCVIASVCANYVADAVMT